MCKDDTKEGKNKRLCVGRLEREGQYESFKCMEHCLCHVFPIALSSLNVEQE